MLFSDDLTLIDSRVVRLLLIALLPRRMHYHYRIRMRNLNLLPYYEDISYSVGC